MTRTDDLEVRFAWVAKGVVVTFGALLAVGLLLQVADPGGALSGHLLRAGLILLMLAPAVRLTLALVERIRRGDWGFVAMTLLVVVELAVVMWRAAVRT